VPLALWIAGVACAVELIGRSVARQSALGALTGLDAGPFALVAAAAAATAGLLPLVWRGASARRRALALLPLVFTVGMAAQLVLAARLQSDGFYYFAHTRSLWFDRDQDLTNDYRILGLDDKPHLFTPTPTGYAQSAWTIGPALAWAPFMGAGHVVAHGLVWSGIDVALDGTSFPYRQAVCVAGLFYGLLGLWWSFRLAERFAPAGLAALATAAVGAGSFLLWYLVKEPSMTHAMSMAGAAGFILYWHQSGSGRSARQWLTLGLIAGLIATIRWQNVLFAILPACDWLALTYGAARSGARFTQMAPVMRRGLLFAAGALVGFLPQMLVWQAIYGAPLAISPVGPQMRFWDPHLVDILFSSRNGLFATSPVLYLAAIGLTVAAWRRPGFGLPVALVCLAMWYLNASVQDWWGSAAFGMRRFDGLIPVFAVGGAVLCATAVDLVGRRPQLVVAAGALALVIWNVTFMQASLTGRFPVGESVSFEQLAGEQAAMLERWAGHPFSYPVNILFALRNDLSPTQYDQLGVDRFLGDTSRPYGRIDIGTPADEGALLLEGWHAPEVDGSTTYRWTTREAGVLLPLDRAERLLFQVQAQAFQFEGAPPQQVTLVVNGRSFGPADVTGGWQVTEIETPADAWNRGINRLHLQFARATRPRDVGLGDDTRALGAAVDVIRFRVVE
jgi:hypothetical protein